MYVHPEHTRRGAGTLLVRAAEEHLAAHGATRLFAWVLDEPGNRAFAERHAYRASRAAHFLRLDLANGTLPPLQDPPPGVELRTGSDFADDPRAAVRTGRGDDGRRTERWGNGAHRLRGLAGGDLEAPAVQPRADLGGGGGRPARRLLRGPHGRRHPVRHGR
ncbi:Mycothiol acetyltransferase [Streptomyces hirsutus]